MGSLVIVLASISSSITHWISENGVYAVFVLMALDALIPAGGELTMLFAGVLASGSIAGHQVSLFGVSVASGIDSYLVLSLAGTIGYFAGALGGWAIGRSGGRTIVERNGVRLHVSPDSLGRAETWFERFGLWAVFFGRITPVVRSFISIPAGVFRTPLPAYSLLTFLGSAIWCFGFAAVGWALGGSWEEFHKNFDYVYVLLAVVAVAAVALFTVRRTRSGRRGSKASSRSAKDTTK